MTKKVPKSTEIYCCEICDYTSSRKSHYERHLLTAKHKKMTNSYKTVPKSTARDFVCECGKSYKHRQNLCIHRKKCEIVGEITEENNEENIEKKEKEEKEEKKEKEEKEEKKEKLKKKENEDESIEKLMSKEGIINLVTDNTDIKKYYYWSNRSN